MRDLRRRALEGNKTVSRKARSKQSSVASSLNNSPATSRNGSRVPSRNVSDDEGELSDTASTALIDELLANEEGLDKDTPYVVATEHFVEMILDPKGQSLEQREHALSAFNDMAANYYVKSVVEAKASSLVQALVKTVKNGKTEKEVVLAIQGLALICVTDPADNLYNVLVKPLRNVVSYSEHAEAKIAAAHALGTATFYGGADEDTTQEIMDYFLEIVQTDGISIEAGDNADVVSAVLEEWGLLATQLDDMEDTSEDAIEVFADQLESSDVGVQVAAGENIALLYEKSFTEVESDDDSDDVDEDYDHDDPSAQRWVRRYTTSRQEHQLKESLHSLSTISGRHMSKKDKKALHTNFADILHTVEHPTHGPRYSTALHPETNKQLGSRMTVSLDAKRQNVLVIDKWWKLHRLHALRRILGGGFLAHYQSNEVIFDTLPVIGRSGDDFDDE